MPPPSPVTTPPDEEAGETRRGQPHRGHQQRQPDQEDRDPRGQEAAHADHRGGQLRGDRGGEDHERHGTGKGDRRVVERTGQVARRDGGEQAECGEDDEHAGRCRQVAAADVVRHRHALGSVAGSRPHRRPGLRRSQHEQQPDHQRNDEHEVRDGQRMACPLGQRTGHHRPDAEAPHVRRGADHLGPPVRCPGTVSGVELAQPRCRRGGEGADPEPGQGPRDDQAGQRRPEQEDHGCHDLEEQRRHEHTTSAVRVGQVPGEDKADHRADGVGGEDDRHDQRREIVPLTVERVERARGRRERDDRQEHGGDGPEAEAVPATRRHASSVRSPGHPPRRSNALVRIANRDTGGLWHRDDE